MRLTNLTPYDTKVLKRIVTAVWRHKWGQVRTQGWNKIQITFYLSGKRVNPRHMADGCYVIRLPKLTGTEWYYLLKQKDGTDFEDPGPSEGPPATMFVGLCVAQALGFQFFRSALEKKAGIPRLLPLKEPVMAKPKPDPIKTRYARVLIREKSWIRKAKLAQTKLRKVRLQRRRYEKKLGL